MPIRAVVFDLDGLIFNTEDIFELTGIELLGRRGHQFSIELRNRMIGRRPQEAFTILKEFCNLAESVETLQAESEVIFRSFVETHLQPMPGLSDLLDHIDVQLLPMAVATSSERRYMQELLDRFELGSRFRFTLAAEDVTQGKPHPEIYLSAAKRLDVLPGEMLVLEDSENGTRAAVAAGAVVVSVPHRHTAGHDFTGARFQANGLADERIRALLNGHGDANEG